MRAQVGLLQGSLGRMSGRMQSPQIRVMPDLVKAPNCLKLFKDFNTRSITVTGFGQPLRPCISNIEGP